MGEVGLSEVDEGSITKATPLGSKLRATEVGVGEVGLSEVDEGSITKGAHRSSHVGSKARPEAATKVTESAEWTSVRPCLPAFGLGGRTPQDTGF